MPVISPVSRPLLSLAGSFWRGISLSRPAFSSPFLSGARCLTPSCWVRSCRGRSEVSVIFSGTVSGLSHSHGVHLCCFQRAWVQHLVVAVWWHRLGCWAADLEVLLYSNLCCSSPWAVTPTVVVVTQAILGTRCLLVHGLRRRLTPGGAFWLHLVLK